MSRFGGILGLGPPANDLVAHDNCFKVRRIQTARVMTRSRSSNTLNTEGKAGVLVRPSSPQEVSLWHKISETVLGVKGSMLKRRSNPIEITEENPVARLKLLLVRA